MLFPPSNKKWTLFSKYLRTENVLHILGSYKLFFIYYSEDGWRTNMSCVQGDNVLEMYVQDRRKGLLIEFLCGVSTSDFIECDKIQDRFYLVMHAASP
jgi:hypothetical protein